MSAVRDPVLEEALARHRVHISGVAKSAGVYFDHGCPVPGQLTEVLDRLSWNGLLVVAEGDPPWELRQVSLTEAGQARYGQLRQQQHIEIAAPAPEFGTTPTARQRHDRSPLNGNDI